MITDFKKHSFKKDESQDGDRFGGVAEPVWISSFGAGVTVIEEQPLFYSWNQDSDNKLCLSAEHTEPYVRDKDISLLIYGIEFF